MQEVDAEMQSFAESDNGGDSLWWGSEQAAKLKQLKHLHKDLTKRIGVVTDDPSEIRTLVSSQNKLNAVIQ